MADPEAVERAIEALPEVREAIVSAVTDRDGDTRLVAHVLAPKRGWSARAMRLALSATLPPFLIPSTFFRVATIPRNTRGKVDRELLRQTAATAVPPAGGFVAPRNAREAALAQLIGEALGLNRVGVHDDIFDLGVDSLSMVGLGIAVSERLGVTVSAVDLLGSPTVEVLARQIDGREEPAERIAVPLHLGGSGTPIFCVPGGGGAGMLALRRLGRRLGRPAFSFIPRGFETRAVPDQTVERAAARFVEALHGVQPSGPYLIAGVSFGGLTAFEMARQLKAAGHDIALLTLIDPISRRPARLSSHAAKAWTDLTGPRASGTDRARHLARRISAWAIDRYMAGTAGLIPRPPARQSDVFFRLNSKMARRYRMRPYDGACLLLRTSEWRRADMLDYARFLTGETRERTIPGNHRTMIGEPHLGTLSEILREELARATAGGDGGSG
jgi:thioesterase domain-containing protein/acyl carrier protein